MKFNLDKVAHYLNQDVSYLTRTQRPITATSHLETFEHEQGKHRTIVTEDKQADYLKACLDSANGEGMTGWTACFAGPANLNFMEYAAAYLAGTAAARGREVLWVDVRRAISLRAHDIQNFSQMGKVVSPELAVFTGLRFASQDDYRWDRIMDLMRSSPAHCSKIVVCSGGNPLSVMEYLALPVQRVCNWVSVGTENY